MKIDLGLDKLGKVISIRYSGTVTFKDLEHNWIDLIDQNIIVSEIRGFVLDYRNTIMDIQVEEIPMLAELFKSNLRIFQKKKFAYITESPNQIILPLLLQEDDLFYESKPFSTIEAATAWVLN